MDKMLDIWLFGKDIQHQISNGQSFKKDKRFWLKAKRIDSFWQLKAIKMEPDFSRAKKLVIQIKDLPSAMEAIINNI